MVLVLVLALGAPAWSTFPGGTVGGGAGVGFDVELAPGSDATLSVEPTSFGAVTTIAGFSGEPNIAAGPDGTVYVTGLGSQGTMVFRRFPGASAFGYLGKPNAPFGGSDEAIAVGPSGALWISGMYWTAMGYCASMTTSADRGSTWSVPVEGVCAGIGMDRQWIAVDDANRPWIVMHENCCMGQHTAYRSDDGGNTFLPVSVTSLSSGFPGNLFLDRARGRIYEATNCQGTFAPPQGPCLLVSPTDPPASAWGVSLVTRYTPAPFGLAHVAGAVDDAGNVYVTWIDTKAGVRAGPHLARSMDGGLTWSAPIRLGDATKLGTMPWVAAGAEGNVAVVWYETAAAAADPNSVPSNAAWHVKAALVRAWATIDVQQLSATPAKLGRICTFGAACDGDRELLDFFEATVGPTGTIHVVWPELASGTLKVADVDAGFR